jgi:hypothetical protein
MTGIIVRRAREDDLAWINTELREFATLYPSKHSIVGDNSYWEGGLRGLVKDHLFLIADKDGERAGLICGVLTTNMFNPKVRVLSEVFWWVAKPFRKSRAGYLLLKEYIEWGRNNSDWILLSSIISSKIREKSLEKLGFRLQERIYLMEV